MKYFTETFALNGIKNDKNSVKLNQLDNEI